MRCLRLSTLLLLAMLATGGCSVYSGSRPYSGEPVAVVTPPARIEYVAVAPPPLRHEYAGPAPVAGHVWIEGYWNWVGGRHDWVPGHWEAPRHGHYWVPYRWQQRGPQWSLHGGYWQRY